MVLIHGSWGDHDNWARVVPGLSENFRVLTYDRRGHSMSQKTTTQGSVEEDAMDVQALLTRLGLAPAHVVGNSYGAHIALTLATKQPSVFKSLMVHEPPLFDLLMGDPSEAIATEGRKRAKAVIKLLENGDKVGGARLFVETLAFGPGQWEKLTPKLKETFINNADTWLDETRDPVGSQCRTEGALALQGANTAILRRKEPSILQAYHREVGEGIAGVEGGDLSRRRAHAPHVQSSRVRKKSDRFRQVHHRLSNSEEIRDLERLEQGNPGDRPFSIVLPAYLFGFSSAIRKSRIALLTICGFWDSRKCVVPGMMHNCAPLIDLNNSSVCSIGIASLSPAITIAGALIFASSSFAMLGSLSHSFFVFSTTTEK